MWDLFLVLAREIKDRMQRDHVNKRKRRNFLYNSERFDDFSQCSTA